MPAAAAAGVAASVVLLSGALPWFRVTLPSGVRFYSGFDVVVLWLPLALVALVVLAGAAGTRGRPGSPAWALAATAAVVVVFGALCELAAVELVGGWMPRELLPSSIRRVTADVSAGPGPWVACVAGFVAVLALTLRRQLRTLLLALRLRPARERAGFVGSVVVIVGVAVAFGWLRYEPWILGHGGGATYELVAPGLPGIGPASLVPILVLGVSVVLIVFGRAVAGALVAAFGGWIMCFMAGMTVLTQDAVARSRVVELVPAGVRNGPLDVALAWPVWVVFAAGLAVAGAGGALILASPRRVDGPSEW